MSHCCSDGGPGATQLDNAGLRVWAKATGRNPEILREPQIGEFVFSCVFFRIVPGRAAMVIRNLWPGSSFFRLLSGRGSCFLIFANGLVASDQFLDTAAPLLLLLDPS